MKTVIVIQARLGSSRLPCKTLLNLHGLPVIDCISSVLLKLAMAFS